MNRTLLRGLAPVVLTCFGLSGCVAGLGARESDAEATRSRLGTLPGSGDPIDAILRAPPSDPRLDEALKISPTLEVVQEAAVRRNPNLKVALERWVAFLERPAQKVVPPYPMFDYRYQSMFKMDMYGVLLGVPFPGKLVTEAHAALADADAMGADYRATENTLRSQAAGAYAALYLARRQVEIVDENLTLLARFIDVAQTKYKAGTATLPDVLRVETERENLLAEREILTKNVEIAASGLNVLLDRKPEEPIGKLAPLSEPAKPDELPALFDRALARRPELDAAKARAASSEYMITRGKQEWIPDLVLGASYVRDFGTQHNFVDLTGGVTLPWVFAPAINARVREAEAQLRGAEAEARSTRNMVLDEVKSSHARVEALAARYRRLTTEVIPRVRKNIEASEAAYVAGQVDFLSLIDTQRTLLSALLDKEAALSEYTTRRAELTRAIGGSTEDRP
jgi:outer membrane protein TolC